MQGSSQSLCLARARVSAQEEEERFRPGQCGSGKKLRLGRAVLARHSAGADYRVPRCVVCVCRGRAR